MAQTTSVQLTPRARTVATSVTRPGDTNAYTAADAISDSTSDPSVLSWSGMGRSGTIVGVTLVMSTATTTNADIDLILFDTTLTANEDNAAADPTDAEMLTSIGVVPFANGDAVATSINKVWYVEKVIPYVTASGSGILYGLPVAAAAYTPGNAEKLTFVLHFIED